MNSFHPPQRVLMGPGPSDVYPRVLEALGRPTIGHLDPDFVGLMNDIKSLLQYALQTDNALTLPISAPGSAGMEACFANLVESGDEVVICQNGVFGGRMKENVERCGATAIMVQDDWGRAVTPDKLRQALQDNPNATLVAFVHAETSTGARSDAAILCEIAREFDCMTIVDGVTSVGGIELALDKWGIDAFYSGTQKCLSCIPGLSPVSFSERAVARIQGRETPVQSWFLDMKLILGYWGEGQTRAYHHTAPVNSMYALHEALLILREEGLEKAWKRHALHHEALKAGLEAMGMSLVVPVEERLPQLNAVSIPEGVDDASTRSALLQQFGLEIGAGLGALAGKVWRIGLMGCSANRRNVILCLSALESVLSASGASIAKGAALEAASGVFND